MHIFTYGSLMYRPVWERVVVGEYASVRGVLHGYARRRITGQTYPALVHAAQTDAVTGVVYLYVSAHDLAALDAFEDEGTAYERVQVPVTIEDGSTLSAWVYVYKHVDAVEQLAWEPDHFERHDLDRFLRTYCYDHVPPKEGARQAGHDD